MVVVSATSYCPQQSPSVFHLLNDTGAVRDHSGYDDGRDRILSPNSIIMDGLQILRRLSKNGRDAVKS
jgi:hypothetical protein